VSFDGRNAEVVPFFLCILLLRNEGNNGPATADGDEEKGGSSSYATAAERINASLTEECLKSPWQYSGNGTYSTLLYSTLLYSTPSNMYIVMYL